MALNVGDVVRGKVVSVMPFGAFVELEQGPTALLLVTKIVPRPVGGTGYPKIGDIVTARISVINGQKIGLTQRNPDEMIEQHSDDVSN